MIGSVPVEVFGLVFAIVMAAALIQSLTGFGFNLVSLPVLSLLIDPRLAVVTVMLLSSLATLGTVAQGRRDLEMTRVAPLLAGTLLGIPLGAYLLVVVSPGWLRLLIGVSVVLGGLPLLFGLSWRSRSDAVVAVPVGFVNGILASSVGLQGPLAVLFLVGQPWRKEALRATLAAYLFAGQLAAVAAAAIGGLLTPTLIVTNLALAPALPFGLFLGDVLHARLHAQLHRSLLAIVVVAAGATVVVSELAR
ncbi:MAG: sulfite exporter TauE/SafE family protein [Chloroflexi bacterium]|nr:sulfite exporter TauE/SafE family protein [Chloroflexota bacterium]